MQGIENILGSNFCFIPDLIFLFNKCFWILETVTTLSAFWCSFVFIPSVQPSYELKEKEKDTWLITKS